MYYTAEEYHIALDQELQQLNSNRKQVLSKEQKDWFLNEAVLEFINTRSNTKTNIKHEGFEQSTERYEELEALKSVIDIPVYLNIVNSLYENYFSFMPSDFLKYVSSRAKVNYNCNNATVAIGTKTIKYVVLPFKHDTATTKYVGLKLTINTSTDIYTRSSNLPTITNDLTRYIIIRDVIEQMKSNTNYEVYYENWNGEYYKDSFIIVALGISVLTTAKLTYTGNTGTATANSTTVYSYVVNPTTGTNEVVNLVSSEDIYNMDSNYYYKKAFKVKPKLEMIDDKFILKCTDNAKALILSYRLNYIRLPRLINLDMNQTCEIPFGEEIVSIAVRKIKARIADPNYKEIINEQQITE